MSGVAHHVAGAALPVALGLLALALCARLALWAPADDARLRAAARAYLAPLCTWCLVATGVYAVALGATGEAGVLGFAVAAVVAGVALALHGWEPATERAPARPEPPAAPVAPPPAAPAGHRSLWAEPEDGARTGLWSR